MMKCKKWKICSVKWLRVHLVFCLGMGVTIGVELDDELSFGIASPHVQSAYAESTSTSTSTSSSSSTSSRTIRYVPASSQYLVNQHYYSSKSTANIQLDVVAPAGAKITKIIQTLGDGSTRDITPPGAKNKGKYNGTLDLRGTPQIAYSRGNNSLRGYVAWYRKQAHRQSTGSWYGEFKLKQQSIQTIACASTEKEQINAIFVSSYPGCWTKTMFAGQPLRLQAETNQSFLVAGNSYQIPDQAITKPLVSQVQVDTLSRIEGPTGVPFGYADESLLEIIDVQSIMVKNKYNYEISYHQNFKIPSLYARELSYPPDGTKLMVYYSAFLVDLKATTYQYPLSLTIQYNQSVVVDQENGNIQNLIQWTPQTIYEGDVVYLWANTSFSTTQKIRYAWKLQDDDGQVKSFTSRDISWRWIKPGTYQVQLIASDGSVEQSQMIQIRVIPLTIDAELGYTPQWLIIHQHQKHQITSNPKPYYSGERIVLKSKGTPVPIREVIASLSTFGINQKPIRLSHKLTATAEKGLYEGEMFAAVFMSLTEGLPVGIHEIKFEIIYENGVTKTTTLPFRILGNIRKATGVHRML